MATYNLTVTTNAADEKGLDFILLRVNTARAEETPPKSAINKTQLLQGAIDGTVTDWKQQYKADLRQRVGVALEAANAAKVTEVAGLLGVPE